MTNAIAAAAMRCKTMADGSLRIEVEVEPKDAQAAFALFGRPGAPMALAALKEGYAAVGNEPEPPKPEEKPKGGLLSQWAAMRCQEPAFQKWIMERHRTHWNASRAASGEARAADVVRVVCGVDTRSKLDTDPNAADLFHSYIRGPWSKHCIATGGTEYVTA